MPEDSGMGSLQERLREKSLREDTIIRDAWLYQEAADRMDELEAECAASMTEIDALRHDIDGALAAASEEATRAATLEQRVKVLEGLVRDAIEDETEFETEWNKAARAALNEQENRNG